MNAPFDFLPAGIWIMAGWVLTAVVHVSFAFAVLSDAATLPMRGSRKTFLVGSGLWALAVLLGGVFVAAVYWVIHHSSLRPQSPLTISPSEPRSPSATPPQAPPPTDY